MLEYILLCTVLFTISRIVYLMSFKSKHVSIKQSKTLIVIGSGGHTFEMIKQVKTLNKKLYEPRLYVMADNDTSSENKILELERNSRSGYSVAKIPRSRVVNQSYFTSVFTTIYSTLHSVPIVLNFKPNLILCNGPGTCIPICIIGFLLKAFLFYEIKIVFIESVCRVYTMSLSGKILLHFADLVIVQWPQLHKKYPKTVHLGRLV